MGPPPSTAIPSRSLRKMVKNARWAMEKRDESGKRSLANPTESLENNKTATKDTCNTSLVQPMVQQKKDGTTNNEEENYKTASCAGRSASLRPPAESASTATTTETGSLRRRGSTGTNGAPSLQTGLEVPMGQNPARVRRGQDVQQHSKLRGTADAVVMPPPGTHCRAFTDSVVLPPPTQAVTATLESGPKSQHSTQKAPKTSIARSSQKSSTSVRSAGTSNQATITNQNQKENLSSHHYVSISSLNSSMSSVTFTDLSAMGTAKPLRSDTMVHPLPLDDDDAHYRLHHQQQQQPHVQVTSAHNSVTNLGHNSCCSIISELSACN